MQAASAPEEVCAQSDERNAHDAIENASNNCTGVREPARTIAAVAICLWRRGRFVSAGGGAVLGSSRHVTDSRVRNLQRFAQMCNILCSCCRHILRSDRLHCGYIERIFAL